MCFDLFARLTMSDRVNLTEAEMTETGQSGQNQESGDDEREGVTYNWSLFHIMFGLATLYVMITVQNTHQTKRRCQVYTVCQVDLTLLTKSNT